MYAEPTLADKTLMIRFSYEVNGLACLAFHAQAMVFREPVPGDFQEMSLTRSVDLGRLRLTKCVEACARFRLSLD